MNRNAFLLSTLALCALAPSVSAQAIFVDARATGTSTGSSWTDAFPTLQGALAVAASGDQVWIAAGTYRPAGPGGSASATFLVPSGVEVYGGFEGTELTLASRAGLFEETILSGDLDSDDQPGFQNLDDNVVHVVTTADGSTGVVIDGLVVAHGHADQPGSVGGSGAGLSVGGNLVLRNAVVRNNLARKFGAGVHARAVSALVLDHVVLADNHAEQNGGAVQIDDGALTAVACRFERNRSDVDGGAIAVEQAVALRDCVFVDNRADGSGGAAYALSAEIDVVGCRFFGNQAGAAGEGGGLSLEQGSGLVRNSIFTGNSAGRGGGLSCVGAPAAGDLTPVVIETSVFYGNAASGALGGGGVYGTQAGLSARNTILWANTAPGVTPIFAQFAGSGASADYCDIQGFDASSTLGVGNLAVEPKLVDPDGADGVIGTPDDDVRLAAGSPCIDRGSNFGAHGLGIDVDGLPRVVDDPKSADGPGGVPPLIDLGPHEFHDLIGGAESISVALGGFAYQKVTVGPAHAGKLYFVLGSASGTHPGLTIGGQLLTLNPDPYFNLTLKEPNHPPLSQSFGTLNGLGEATAVFTLPPGLDPVLVGLSLRHACAVLSPIGAPLLTTTAYPLALVP